MRKLAAILPLLLAACVTTRQPDAMAEVFIRVDGMTRVQGITWLDWPNAVKTALEGLNGILELETDLASDTFRVAYDPRRTGVDAMLTAISEVGYQGREVPAAAFGAPVRWRISDLPAELQELFAQAKSEHRLVLIDVHGPGWLPCAKMERVTYPNPDVQKVLERFYLRQVLDLELDSQAAEALGVLGIPVAIVADAKGNELARIEGFVEPQDYARQLNDLAGEWAANSRAPRTFVAAWGTRSSTSR